MKKLMFATALVASVAAFGAGEANAMTALNAISFEGYNAGDRFRTGQKEFDEAGVQKEAAYGYFCFEGDSDSSVVTNGNPSAKRTAYFKDAVNTNNYLALDTEGGTLWRSINTLTQYPVGEDFVYSNGTACAVAENGTYLDTLVQFTVTEDEEPQVGSEDKLAIWLGVVTNNNGEVTGTNLMVRARVVGDGSSTPMTFIANNEVLAGTWYRLTVKAVKDITDGELIPGYQIYLDGNIVTSSTITIESAFLEEFFASDSHYADIAAGKYFASLRDEGASPTIQSVGFQGTGAVDEIVWTEDDPFPASTVEFTLTYSGDSYVTLGAVTYTIGEGAAETVTFSAGTAQIPQGATVTIAAPTYTEGYQLASLTTNDTAVTIGEFPFTFEMTDDITVAITSELIPAAYPTYIDTTDATIKAKYDAWKTGVGCDDATASQYLNQFLLNVDEATTVGDTALTITEIKENATAGWDITIGCTVSGASLTGTVGETIVCNGYLAVSYTDDLTGTWTTENIAITAVDATAGTVTVNVNKSGAKFMKVSLTAAPQPAAGE